MGGYNFAQISCKYQLNLLIEKLVECLGLDKRILEHIESLLVQSYKQSFALVFVALEDICWFVPEIMKTSSKYKDLSDEERVEAAKAM